MAVFILSGCASFAADVALKDAEAKCARQGKQFAMDKAEKTELIVVAAAQVSGHCVGPAEPGYVSPTHQPER